MKNLVLVLLAITFLGSSLAANAVTIESSTSVYLTFRQCVSGETACDSLTGTQVKTMDGLPGNTNAEASQDDPAYGMANGSVTFTDMPGGTKHSGKVVSLPGTRNGSNTPTLQKYTNTGTIAETITFEGVLTYEQIVPDGNADFAEKSPGRSSASAELGIIQFNTDSIEAGTTAEDNFRILMEGPEPQEGLEINELGFDATDSTSNISETGSRTASVEVTVNPGDTIWMWAIMQSLAANGAEVSGSFTTQLHHSSAEAEKGPEPFSQ